VTNKTLLCAAPPRRRESIPAPSAPAPFSDVICGCRILQGRAEGERLSQRRVREKPRRGGSTRITIELPHGCFAQCTARVMPITERSRPLRLTCETVGSRFDCESNRGLDRPFAGAGQIDSPLTLLRMGEFISQTLETSPARVAKLRLAATTEIAEQCPSFVSRFFSPS
jgi:hypothetical protein